MPGGKPYDHPLTDVLNYGFEVYGCDADEKLRELAKLMDSRNFWKWWEQEVGFSIEREQAAIKIREQYDRVTASPEQYGKKSGLLAGLWSRWEEFLGLR